MIIKMVYLRIKTYKNHDKEFKSKAHCVYTE